VAEALVSADLGEELHDSLADALVAVVCRDIDVLEEHQAAQIGARMHGYEGGLAGRALRIAVADIHGIDQGGQGVSVLRTGKTNSDVEHGYSKSRR